MPKLASENEHRVIDVEKEVPDLDASVLGGPLEKLKPVPDALAHFQRLESLLPKLRDASIRATRPQDWVAMGDSVYLQGTGAERVAGFWRMVLGHPEVMREDYPDGTYSYVVDGPCLSMLTGVIYQGIQGGRWSGEGFFERLSAPRPAKSAWDAMEPEDRAAWTAQHRLPPNPLDVRKAALTNWQDRCVSMIAGLRGMTVADLEKYGIRPARGVKFAGGAQGGKAATTNESGEALIPFGSNKGKTLGQLSDKELSSLMGYFQSCVEDREKAKYKAHNENWVTQCEREIERRSREENA